MALISLAVAPGVVSILRRPILTPHKAAATLAAIWPGAYPQCPVLTALGG